MIGGIRGPLVGVAEFWRQPVRNRGRVGWVGHRADRVVPPLVPHGDPRLLQELLLPGRDDELFQDPARHRPARLARYLLRCGAC